MAIDNNFSIAKFWKDLKYSFMCYHRIVKCFEKLDLPVFFVFCSADFGRSNVGNSGSDVNDVAKTHSRKKKVHICLSCLDFCLSFP